MKKCILSLVLILVVGQTAFAQDLDKLITQLSQIENVEYQVISREMLDMQLQAAKDADASGELAAQLPSFLQKIDSIVVVAAEEATAETKKIFEDEFVNFKDGNGYETLLNVSDEEDKVLIISRKVNGKIDLFIFAISDEEVALVKMSGNFEMSDITDIIEQQKKNL